MREFVLTDKRTGEVVFRGSEATRSTPCWACEHLHSRPSWCLVDEHGGLVICQRVQSDRRIGDAGWLHRRNSLSVALPPVVRTATVEPTVDMTEQWQRCETRVTTADYTRLAEVLGLPAVTFPVHVDLGMYGGSWAFAMRDPSGRVCGIKLRNKDGTKSCVRGSRLGLIETRTFDRLASSVLVTEGESDAFVASHWGFNAVGRPGAKACSTHLASLCKGKDVVLMADRDPAGMDGARTLAADIRKRCRSCVIVTPPPGTKDLRAWMADGGSADALAWLVRSSRGW